MPFNAATIKKHAAAIIALRDNHIAQLEELRESHEREENEFNESLNAEYDKVRADIMAEAEKEGLDPQRIFAAIRRVARQIACKKHHDEQIATITASALDPDDSSSVGDDHATTRNAALEQLRALLTNLSGEQAETESDNTEAD